MSRTWYTSSSLDASQNDKESGVCPRSRVIVVRSDLDQPEQAHDSCQSYTTPYVNFGGQKPRTVWLNSKFNWTPTDVAKKKSPLDRKAPKICPEWGSNSRPSDIYSLRAVIELIWDRRFNQLSHPDDQNYWSYFKLYPVNHFTYLRTSEEDNGTTIFPIFQPSRTIGYKKFAGFREHGSILVRLYSGLPIGLEFAI